MSINYTKKSFMKLATGVNFIKLFLQNLRPQRQNLSQNLRQYADKGISYYKKV